MKRPEIQYAITNFNPNFPQYQMDVNVRAKDAGVEIATIFYHYAGIMVVCIPQTLTSLESNTVMIQAKPEDRANLESINIYVMNNSGQKWR
jgi:HAE1 family hydrophobic/amphiphilic exporter-1